MSLAATKRNKVLKHKNQYQLRFGCHTRTNQTCCNPMYDKEYFAKRNKIVKYYQMQSLRTHDISQAHSKENHD